jgi:hypothetical protein
MLGLCRVVGSVIRRRATTVMAASPSSTLLCVGSGSGTSLIRSTSVPTLTRRGLAAMPLPQSATAVLFEGHEANEGWETTIFVWYATSFAMCVAILGLEPETGIDAWASKEARVRLEMKDAGFAGPFVFGKHYQSLSDDEIKREWDTFSSKALRMNDDDDDDDEEEEADDDEEEEEDDDDDE